jgi:8-oxo-dGTP pyrophosphatase MutT (NUDIX family)
VSAFAVPASDYISAHTPSTPYYDAIATGSLVFSDSNKVLLVQRASHDSMPLLWETPGGACDDEDSSILHAAARELWEEAGLTTVRVMGVVGEGFCFGRRTGPQVKKFNFIMEVEEGEVKLSDEHVAYVWATEDEVRVEQVGDLKIPITKPEQKDVVLRGFEMVSQMRQGLT